MALWKMITLKDVYESIHYEMSSKIVKVFLKVLMPRIFVPVVNASATPVLFFIFAYASIHAIDEVMLCFSLKTL